MEDGLFGRSWYGLIVTIGHRENIREWRLESRAMPDYMLPSRPATRPNSSNTLDRGVLISFPLITLLSSGVATKTAAQH